MLFKKFLNDAESYIIKLHHNGGQFLENYYFHIKRVEIEISLAISV